MNIFTETFLRESKEALKITFVFKFLAYVASIPVMTFLAVMKINFGHYFYTAILAGVSAYGAYKCISEFKNVKHIVVMMVFGTMIFMYGLVVVFGSIDPLGVIFPLFGIVTLIRILFLLFSMEAFLLILTKFFFEIIELFRVNLKAKKL